jgi:membrane protease subunit HflC
MNRNLAIGAGALAAVVLALALSALFTVHQTEQALVLQFGDPKRKVTEPGLHFKLPFVQNAVYIDRRVLDFDGDAQEVILGDQKRLVVDAFARYRIVDPLRFYQAVGTEAVLRGRVDTILDASLRKVLGEVPLFTVLSADRSELMNKIRVQANTETKQFGIDIIDVRIKRADLPTENSQAIYRRMQTERDREAKELRAQGAELAQRIRARADRERRVILAEAGKESQIIRGQGDAQAVKIFADAFGRDVDFFTFYRSMQAYRNALADDSTSVVLTPDSQFFRFFDSPEAALQTAHGAEGTPGPAAASSETAPSQKASGQPASSQTAPPAATVGVDQPPAASAVE